MGKYSRFLIHAHTTPAALFFLFLFILNWIPKINLSSFPPSLSLLRLKILPRLKSNGKAVSRFSECSLAARCSLYSRNRRELNTMLEHSSRISPFLFPGSRNQSRHLALSRERRVSLVVASASRLTSTAHRQLSPAACHETGRPWNSILMPVTRRDASSSGEFSGSRIHGREAISSRSLPTGVSLNVAIGLQF